MGGGLKFHKKEVCNIWTATKLSDHRILTNIPDHFQSNIFMIMVIRIIIRTIKIIILTDGNYAGQQWTTLSLEKWSLCLRWLFSYSLSNKCLHPHHQSNIQNKRLLMPVVFTNKAWFLLMLILMKRWGLCPATPRWASVTRLRMMRNIQRW